MADVSSIINYYVDLLIIQYADKPKARATIALYIEELMATGILFDVRDAFNLETAIGVQLDIIGKYVDLDRFYSSSDLSGDYFGFADAADIGGTSANIVGFDDAAAPDKTGFFLDASEVISNNMRLNDDAFRTLIKFRIVQNNSDHSVKSITDSIFAFFNTSVLVKDNLDMTMTYFVGDYSNSLIRAALQKKVLPKPMGVRLEALNGNQFFGFADAANLDIERSYLSGFNDAAVGFTQEGRFLSSTYDIIT
jgi:hypothetical protein